MALKRDQEQLNNIAGQFDRKAHFNHPGLGMILLVFDDIERVKRDTKLAIVLRGIKPEDAIRMLRETADNIEHSERTQPLVAPAGPLIIKPGDV